MGTFSVRKTTAQFIAEASIIHGDQYDYSKVEYINNHTKVCITCKKHGDFWQTPNMHLRKRGCPICKSLVYKKPLFGVGVNDLLLHNNTKVYNVWKDMLRRCYDTKNHHKNITYKDCKVCDEWLTLSNFKAWFDENYQESYELDKDIIIKNNKIYSPDSCCFVPKEINTLLTNRRNKRGKYYIGVTKNCNKYVSTVSICGKKHIIGYYSDEYTAFIAYKSAKDQYVKELAEKYFKEGKITDKVYHALMRYEVEITD
jgi:hypothetical protein